MIPHPKMHIKLSGIAMLGGAALLVILSGTIIARLISTISSPNTGDSSKAPSIALPDHLAKSTDKYHPVYTDRLTTEWSRSTKTEFGFGPSIYTLEQGHFAEVRCNGDDSYRFLVDHQSSLYLNGKRVADTSKWRPCNSVQVRSASPQSVNIPYLVAMTAR